MTFIGYYWQVVAGLWVLSIVGSCCKFLTLFYISKTVCFFTILYNTVALYHPVILIHLYYDYRVHQLNLPATSFAKIFHIFNSFCGPTHCPCSVREVRLHFVVSFVVLV